MEAKWLGATFRQIKDWLEQQKINKRQEIVYQGFKDLHALTVTIHGRVMLTEVLKDPDNGLEPEIKRMYWVLLSAAPIVEWSQYN